MHIGGYDMPVLKCWALPLGLVSLAAGAGLTWGMPPGASAGMAAVVANIGAMAMLIAAIAQALTGSATGFARSGLHF
jgi:hypothetical protein